MKEYFIIFLYCASATPSAHMSIALIPTTAQAALTFCIIILRWYWDSFKRCVYLSRMFHVFNLFSLFWSHPIGSLLYDHYIKQTMLFPIIAHATITSHF